MTIQTNTEVEAQFALDLEHLDTNMDGLHAHYVYLQEGATTPAELMALPTITGLCGYRYAPRRLADKTTMTCPKCIAIFEMIR